MTTDNAQEIKLLQEIREDQIRQTETVINALKEFTDAHIVYKADLKKAEGNRAEYTRSLEEYRKTTRRKNVVFYTVLALLILNLIWHMVAGK